MLQLSHLRIRKKKFRGAPCTQRGGALTAVQPSEPRTRFGARGSALQMLIHDFDPGRNNPGGVSGRFLDFLVFSPLGFPFDAVAPVDGFLMRVRMRYTEVGRHWKHIYFEWMVVTRPRCWWGLNIWRGTVHKN